MTSFTLKKTPMNALLLLEAMAINMPARFCISEFSDAFEKEYFEVFHTADYMFSLKIMEYIYENNIFKKSELAHLPTD